MYRTRCESPAENSIGSSLSHLPTPDAPGPAGRTGDRDLIHGVEILQDRFHLCGRGVIGQDRRRLSPEGQPERAAAARSRASIRGGLGRLMQSFPDSLSHAQTMPEVLRGEVKDIQGRLVEVIKPPDFERSRVQRPELFDYAKKRPQVVITP